MVQMWKISPSLIWPHLFVLAPCSIAPFLLITNSKCQNDANQTTITAGTVEERLMIKLHSTYTVWFKLTQTGGIKLGSIAKSASGTQLIAFLIIFIQLLRVIFKQYKATRCSSVTYNHFDHQGNLARKKKKKQTETSTSYFKSKTFSVFHISRK